MTYEATVYNYQTVIGALPENTIDTPYDVVITGSIYSTHYLNGSIVATQRYINLSFQEGIECYDNIDSEFYDNSYLLSCDMSNMICYISSIETFCALCENLISFTFPQFPNLTNCRFAVIYNESLKTVKIKDITSLMNMESLITGYNSIETLELDNVNKEVLTEIISEVRESTRSVVLKNLKYKIPDNQNMNLGNISLTCFPALTNLDFGKPEGFVNSKATVTLSLPAFNGNDNAKILKLHGLDATVSFASTPALTHLDTSKCSATTLSNILDVVNRTTLSELTLDYVPITNLNLDGTSLTKLRARYCDRLNTVTYMPPTLTDLRECFKGSRVGTIKDWQVNVNQIGSGMMTDCFASCTIGHIYTKSPRNAESPTWHYIVKNGDEIKVYDSQDSHDVLWTVTIDKPKSWTTLAYKGVLNRRYVSKSGDIVITNDIQLSSSGAAVPDSDITLTIFYGVEQIDEVRGKSYTIRDNFPMGTYQFVYQITGSSYPHAFSDTWTITKTVEGGSDTIDSRYGYVADGDHITPKNKSAELGVTSETIYEEDIMDFLNSKYHYGRNGLNPNKKNFALWKEEGSEYVTNLPQGPAGPRGPQGPKGDKGDKGDQGNPGVTVPTSGMFGFYIDNNTGHLMLTYSGNDQPDLTINANGELIYSYQEE